MKKTGDEYFDSEEFRELLAEYEDSVSKGEPVFMDAEELAEIADYYHFTGNADKADEAISLALSLSPDATAPLNYKFHEALDNDDVERAEEMLDKMVDKSAPEYIYDQAELMLYEGHADDADNYLKRHLADVPEEELQDYLIDVATLLTDYDQHEQAMQWLTKAEKEDTAEYKEIMAHMLLGLGQYDDSLKLYNELIDSDPYSIRYWNGLANNQFMLEDYDQAIESSEFAIAINPDAPESILVKANGLYYLNNYEDAATFYERYLKLRPDDPYVMLHLGTCYINQGRIDDAIATLQQAYQLARDDEDIHYDICQELAFAYNDKGQMDKALELLDTAADDSPWHSQQLIVKGHLLLSAGNIGEAEDLFREAITTSDKPFASMLRVIVSLYDNHYVKAAYTLFKRFFKAIPDDFCEGYAYMALCCYDLQRHDEFMHYLKTACQLNPQECRMVLSPLFPPNVKPADYYDYAVENFKKK